jgi:hypothetical protein
LITNNDETANREEERVPELLNKTKEQIMDYRIHKRKHTPSTSMGLQRRVSKA